VSVPRLDLTAALESEDGRIVELAVLGDGGMQLWETLQTRQLVEDEPDASGVRNSG